MVSSIITMLPVGQHGGCLQEGRASAGQEQGKAQGSVGGRGCLPCHQRSCSGGQGKAPGVKCLLCHVQELFRKAEQSIGG